MSTQISIILIYNITINCVYLVISRDANGRVPSPALKKLDSHSESGFIILNPKHNPADNIPTIYRLYTNYVPTFVPTIFGTTNLIEQ